MGSGDCQANVQPTIRLAVTGPEGFLAWHTRVAWLARGGSEVIGLGRTEFGDPAAMDQRLSRADAVIHLAGVNRASDDDAIAKVNPWLAEQLVSGLERIERVIPVVYGNSIHSSGDSVFGAAKQRAADILTGWGLRSGAPVADVVLPNIFGEHGRPFYNSAVSTFCHQLARGERPKVQVDREMPLLHAQRAASELLNAATSGASGRFSPEGNPLSVTALLDRLIPMSSAYRTGDLPNLSNPFTRDLFNTYRSFTVPGQWPLFPQVNADIRGDLVEAVRAGGGQTQVFFSTTNPGATRGNHFHLHKVERFLVLRGRAVIRMRRLFTDDIVEFPVSGESPGIVDMPTMWTHSITNTGDDQMLAAFYADEIFDPSASDTHPLPVLPL